MQSLVTTDLLIMASNIRERRVVRTEWVKGDRLQSPPPSEGTEKESELPSIFPHRQKITLDYISEVDKYESDDERELSLTKESLHKASQDAIVKESGYFPL
jgi:hypothetical protein